MIERPLTDAFAADDGIAALFAPDAEIAAMLRFEAALAEAQAGAGPIPAEAAAAIVTAIVTVVADRTALARGLARDGVAVPDLVRQIRAAVGEPHARFVHVGATSQDVIGTALMLRLQGVLGLLGDRLAALLALLDEMILRDGAVVLMAHTRMQAALSFTTADKLRPGVRRWRRMPRGWSGLLARPWPSNSAVRSAMAKVLRGASPGVGRARRTPRPCHGGTLAQRPHTHPRHRACLGASDGHGR